MYINIPYLFVNLTLFCIYLIGFQLFIPLPFTSFLDEVLMGLSILLIFTNSSFIKKCKGVYSIFVIYFIYNIINYLISPYSNSFYMMLLQSCITIKVFIIMLALFLSYTSLNIAHKFKLWRKIKFTIYLFTCIFFIALLLNIIMGTSWMNMWDLPIMYRNDMLRIFGMFKEGGANGYYIAFIVTTLLFFKLSGKLNFRNVLVISIVAVLLSYISSYRKTVLFCLPLLICYNKSLAHNKRFLNVLLGIICILVFTPYLLESSYSEETIRDLSNFTNNDSNYIRGLLFYNGFWLAFNRFPFGTGAATFGSVYSQFNTLEVYRLVGMERWILDFEDGGAEIFDNYLGSVVAELGLFGMIIYIILIIRIFKLVCQSIPSTYKIWFKITYVYLLITSTMGPFICSADGVIIYSLFFLYFLLKNENVSDIKYVSRR